MTNYSLKSEVLTEHYDYVLLAKKIKKLNWLNNYSDIDASDELYQNYALVDYLLTTDKERYEEAEKIAIADSRRLVRLSHRIRLMLNDGQCFFLTLTFKDDVLNSTTDKTRRAYVRRFLKENSITYVANVDYGDKNGREHYHAVVRADSINMMNWNPYGFSNAKPIRSTDDYLALTRYVSKLANHAMKETVKRNYVIYGVLPENFGKREEALPLLDKGDASRIDNTNNRVKNPKEETNRLEEEGISAIEAIIPNSLFLYNASEENAGRSPPNLAFIQNVDLVV